MERKNFNAEKKRMARELMEYAKEDDRTLTAGDRKTETGSIRQKNNK